ncbi:MAG: hypothetical protein AAGI25_13000 [Bacteroidota bacterium]
MIKTSHDIMHDLTQRAMKLWDVETEEDFDPLIQLLLRVFSYEIHKVSEYIQVSNEKLAEHLARVLVHETWSLPSPAHGLLQAFPEGRSVIIDEKFQFYATQFNFGSENEEYFFTPIASHQLIPARVYCSSHNRELQIFSESGEVLDQQITKASDQRITDFTLVVGVEISLEDITKLTDFPICMLLEDSTLAPFIRIAKVFDIEGNELVVKPLLEEQPARNIPHYFTSIRNYYKHFLYTINISGAKKELKTLTEQFSGSFETKWMEPHDASLFWLKIQLPVAFDSQELKKFKISINTFPVINRKLHEVQHKIDKNGRIISLPVSDQDFFMGIEGVIDNHGEAYREISKNDINRPEGSYSVFYGNVEQFDENSAKTLITKVLEKVREEGSAFSALGYDLLNAYLKDLEEKLNLIEEKVDSKYKKTNNATGERQYIVTQPLSRSTFLECQYWVCNADTANDIDRYTPLSQYRNYGLKTSTITFLTKTVGGDVKRTEKEKISNLRYGLLSRDRLVSKEDIAEFVRKTLGKIVEEVIVSPGVSISPNPKQGLVRTVDIEIKLTLQTNLSVTNKQRLGHFLESELETKSIQNVPYQIKIL